jgi:hypothetical protein
VPAFEGLIATLQELQNANISAFNTIQPGIEKLEDYQGRTTYAPAYILAICKLLIFLITSINNYQSA